MEQNSGCQSNEINLLEYWGVIKKWKTAIGALVAIVTSVTIVASLVATKYYVAEAVIMPLTKGSAGSGGLAALVGQFSGLIPSVGGVAQSSSQQFMALLKTKTLAEEIINEYNLTSFFFDKVDAKGKQPTMAEKVKALMGSVNFFDDKKSGTIKISAEVKDPKFAANIANWYVKGLQKFVNENSLTLAKRNRIFIEHQLAQNKRNLLEAGKELNEFYKTGKISSVDSKIDVPVTKSDPNERLLIATLPVESRNDTQLAELQEQRELINKKMSVIGDVPQQVYLQYLTLNRSLLAQINTLLAQQYEIAKIDESKDELAFQVIDPARVPENRSKPARKQMVMMAFIISSIAGVFMAFIIEYVLKLKRQMKKG